MSSTLHIKERSSHSKSLWQCNLITWHLESTENAILWLTKMMWKNVKESWQKLNWTHKRVFLKYDIVWYAVNLALCASIEYIWAIFNTEIIMRKISRLLLITYYIWSRTISGRQASRVTPSILGTFCFICSSSDIRISLLLAMTVCKIQRFNFILKK